MNRDKELVMAEFDVAWAAKGGVDPAQYIEKYAQRVPQVHLKDYDPKREDVTEIGEGMVDLAAVHHASLAAGSKWIIYEQDRSTIGDPMARPVSPKSSFEGSEVCGAPALSRIT